MELTYGYVQILGAKLSVNTIFLYHKLLTDFCARFEPSNILCTAVKFFCGPFCFDFLAWPKSAPCKKSKTRNQQFLNTSFLEPQKPDFSLKKATKVKDRDSPRLQRSKKFWLGKFFLFDFSPNWTILSHFTMSIHYVKNRKKDAFFYHIIRWFGPYLFLRH